MPYMAPMAITAKVLSNSVHSESLHIDRIQEETNAQFNVRTEVFRILQDESNEVTRCVQMERSVLWDDVGGHRLVHSAPVLPPSRPVVHQDKEPLISDPRRQINTRLRNNSLPTYSCTMTEVGRSEEFADLLSNKSRAALREPRTMVSCPRMLR